jgi:hypothetical protein
MNTLGLVDAFESVEHVRALMFDYLHLLNVISGTDVSRLHLWVTDTEKTHLAKGALPNDSVEIKVTSSSDTWSKFNRVGRSFLKAESKHTEHHDDEY